MFYRGYVSLLLLFSNPEHPQMAPNPARVELVFLLRAVPWRRVGVPFFSGRVGPVLKITDSSTLGAPSPNASDLKDRKKVRHFPRLRGRNRQGLQRQGLFGCKMGPPGPGGARALQNGALNTMAGFRQQLGIWTYIQHGWPFLACPPPPGHGRGGNGFVWPGWPWVGCGFSEDIRINFSPAAAWRVEEALAGSRPVKSLWPVPRRWAG